MSKETFIARFALIIRRLENGPATYDQIADFLQTESDIHDKNYAISIRTLQRDIKDIYSQFNIEIVNEKSGDKRYYIKSRPETVEHSQRLMESYQIINAINASQDFADKVFLETRQPKGLEHFHGLLYAINQKRILQFNHFKYWDETITDRKVHPLALKEAQGRWYLIAVDTQDKRLKTFGLDRMDMIDIQKTSFREKYAYNLKELFQDAFGIVFQENQDPEMVQLKFSYEQGQYIKTYPLHHSQQIVKESKDELVVELRIHITFDFVKEMLSFGPELVVLQPESLRTTISNQLRKTIEVYS
ncbi:MAG: WYL domain-containing protein [bacterium]